MRPLCLWVLGPRDENWLKLVFIFHLYWPYNIPLPTKVKARLGAFRTIFRLTDQQTMWFKLFIAVLFSSLWFVSAVAQVNTNQGPFEGKLVNSGQTNLLLVYPQFHNTVLRTNLNGIFPLREFSTNQFPAQFLKPGLYKTEPYTCIVIVPDKQADDRAVHKPTVAPFEMPVTKPELRFVPIPTK